MATLEQLRDVFGVTVRCIAGVSVALLHSPCGIVSNGLGNLLGCAGSGSDLSIMRFEDFDSMLFDDQPDQAQGCNPE